MTLAPNLAENTAHRSLACSKWRVTHIERSDTEIEPRDCDPEWGNALESITGNGHYGRDMQRKHGMGDSTNVLLAESSYQIRGT